MKSGAGTLHSAAFTADRDNLKAALKTADVNIQDQVLLLP
jgi:hypothetical protein